MLNHLQRRRFGAASAMTMAIVMLMQALPAPAAPFAYLGRGNAATINVVDLETRAIVATPAMSGTGGPYSVAVSRSTGKVFIGNQSGANSVVMFNAASHTIERYFAMGGPVNAVTVTPDGSRVYAAMRDTPHVKAVDVATGNILATMLVGASAFGMAATPDGSKVLVVNTNSSNISVIDVATNTVVHTIGSRNLPQTIAFSPDGSLAFVPMWSANQLQVIHMNNNYADGHVGVGVRPLGVAVSPDGSRVYVTNGGSHTVTVLNGTTFEFITNIDVGANSQPCGVSVTADGTAVYVTRLNNNDVVRIDTATNAVTDTIPLGAITFAMGTFTTGPTVPAPPAITASAGVGQITVNFTPSVNNGGHPITGYTVSCGAFSTTTMTSPVVFNSVTNGTSYACSAYATNAMGNSGSSNVVNVIPGNVPTAPTFTSIIEGNGTITAHFSPPASNGGAAISSYRFYCTANNSTNSASGAASPLTVTGLTNGLTYQCTIRAFNSIGQGALAPNVAATPRTVPNAPTIIDATAQHGSASLRFQPPAFNGGAAISGYVGRCSGGFSANVSAGSDTVQISGLTNGQPYSCNVTAVNVAGESSPSASQNLTPATYADAPTLLSATAGNGTIELAFTAPANNGGAAIERYVADCSGGATGSASQSPIVLTGLGNGTTYDCSILARNRIGDSDNSNVLQATPATTPDAPTLSEIVASDGELTLHFTAPLVNGGADISAYVATCGSENVEATASPIVFDDLTNGQSYDCTLVARNRVGDGPPSNLLSGTPRRAPDAPTIQAIAPGNGQATISFSPPAFDGGAAITSYRVQCDRGVGDIDPAVSPQIIGGLDNGLVYRCAVQARNAAGFGPLSDEMSVIPGAASTSADLSISKTNSLSFVSGGLRTGYVITVTNAGPDAVAGAEVIDELEDYFSNTQWTCTPTGEARCAASGQGDLHTLIDLPAGSSATIVLDAELAPFPEDPVFNVASIAVPAPMTDPDPANNVASDGPDVRGIFRDEFE